MAGDISQFFGAAKSYQHGVIPVAAASSATATISAVDTTKYVLMNQGSSLNGGTAGPGQLVLTNSTTITVSFGSVVTGSVAYTIVDFY